MWRSRNVRIIRAVPAWSTVSLAAHKPFLSIRLSPPRATKNGSNGPTATGATFSRYLQAVIQKDYAVGYLCLATLSKGTTALWTLLEVLAYMSSQSGNSQAGKPSAGPSSPSSGHVLARAMEDLGAPRSLTKQLAEGVAVPSAQELAGLLKLSRMQASGHIRTQSTPPTPRWPMVDGRGQEVVPDSPTNPEPPQPQTPGDPAPAFSSQAAYTEDKPGIQSELSQDVFPQLDQSETRPAGDGLEESPNHMFSHEISLEMLSPSLSPSSASLPGSPGLGGQGPVGGANRNNGGGSNSGGGGGGGGEGNGEGKDQPPDEGGSRQPQPSWLAVALSIALVLPPSGLVELLWHLARPLLPAPRRQHRPLLARRVTPRKRRFVLLQHAATQALDGESFLVLSPTSAAATLLFPSGPRTSTAAGTGDEFFHLGGNGAMELPEVMAEMQHLPLNAQLAGLAGALTAAYERESCLAARLITRRAVSYAIHNEKVGELTAALDESSRTLALSQRRMEAISQSMEALQEELERDVSLLCKQLESVSEHRDALLAEVETSQEQLATTAAARSELLAQLQAAEAERQQMRTQLAEARTRLEESDANVRQASLERDQERHRSDSLAAQLKHAVHFVAAIEGTMSAVNDLSDNTHEPDVSANDASAPTVPAPDSSPPSSPLRTALHSVRHRVSELTLLQHERDALQEQLDAQLRAHAADAAALARAEREALDTRGEVARLEAQLAEAAQARQDLEAELASAHAMIVELQARLQASSQELSAVRKARAAAEAQLHQVRDQLQNALSAAAGSEDARRIAADQLVAAVQELDAERASLDRQLQIRSQELASARTHLQHAQHHVAEALVEKSTLRQQLALARQQLQAAEAQAASQGDRCLAAEGASAALAAQLAGVQAEVTALAEKLQVVQANAGSDVAARAALEVHVQLARAQQQAAACAATASEELQHEVAELQARLSEAHLARQVAEQEATVLRDRAEALEAQLVQARNARALEADAQDQRMTDLRTRLATTTSALRDAQAAAQAASKAEASQAAAVAATAATVAGLQITIQQLRQSLAAAEQELQQRRAAAAGLQADLAQATSRVSRDQEAVRAEAKLDLYFTRLADHSVSLQRSMTALEAASDDAVARQQACTAELQQRCEEGYRSVLDLQRRLVDSEAARQALLSQVAEAEVERARLMAQVAAAEADHQELQRGLHAAGTARRSLEDRVALGEDERSELEGRLARADEVLSETLSQLQDANSAVRLLHQRLLAADSERMQLKAQLAATPDLRAELVARLTELQNKVDLVEAASAEASETQAARVTELQRRCEEGEQSVLALRGKLEESETSRQALMAQAAEAEVERQQLTAQLEETQAEEQRLLILVADVETEQQDLREMLQAAVEERRALEVRAADAEAARCELQLRLQGAERARAEAQAQLSFTSSALQLLQRHLNSADAERLDLQARLVATVEERRELRAQLTERSRELQAKIEAAEAVAAAATSRLSARATEICARCEESDRQVLTLQEQLTAAKSARQEVLARATAAEAAQSALASRLEQAEAEQQRVLVRAYEAEAEQRRLQDALAEAQEANQGLVDAAAGDRAQREDLQARLQEAHAAQLAATAQLSEAKAALQQLQQGLGAAEAECLSLQAQLKASVEERCEIQQRLAARLLDLERQMGTVQAASADAEAMHAAQATALQQRLEVDSLWIQQLQTQLAASEASRQELVGRMTEVDTDRSSLLSRLEEADARHRASAARAAEAEAVQHSLEETLAAAEASRRELQAQIGAGEAARAQLAGRLADSEAAHHAALSQLLDTSAALQAMQLRADSADAEREALHAQLDASSKERRELQALLAAHLLEMQQTISQVEATAVAADAAHAAQAAELRQRCHDGGRLLLELRAKLVESEVAQQGLRSQVAQVEAERLQLVAQVAASEAEQRQLQLGLRAAEAARLALEAKIADGETERRQLATRLSSTEAQCSEALAQLAGANAALRALQQRLDVVDAQRRDLQEQLDSVVATRQELMAELATVKAAHQIDGERLAAVEQARELLAERLSVTEASVLDLQQRLSAAESACVEAQALRTRAVADGEAQHAAALQASQLLEAQLSEAEAVRQQLQAQVVANEAALQEAQGRVEESEAACRQSHEQLASTDALVQELVAQFAEGEAQRQELQEQLEAMAAASTGLQAHLTAALRERDGLAVQLAEVEAAAGVVRQQLSAAQLDREKLMEQLAAAEAARTLLQGQVNRFRTQQAVAQDAQVIRRMTNATALQEQLEHQQAEAQARQQQMQSEIDALRITADEQAVRTAVRIALSRACWRAAEEERRALQDRLEQWAAGGGPSSNRSGGGGSSRDVACSHDMGISAGFGAWSGREDRVLVGSLTAEGLPLHPGMAAVDASQAFSGRIRRSCGAETVQTEGEVEGVDEREEDGGARVLSLGGGVPERQYVVAAPRTEAPPAAEDGHECPGRLQSYQQQLEHVRQRLMEMRPQTVSCMAAVDAALEVPSSFAAMVHLAVSQASPQASVRVSAREPQLLLDGPEDRPRDPLRDSFSMVPDLGSLGNMLEINSAPGSQGGSVPMPAARQEAPQARCPPTVPFSTPVTAYRKSGGRGSRFLEDPSASVLPSGALSPTVYFSPLPIEDQLAALQQQLNKVEETGKRLGERLDAARLLPTSGILEAVTAQMQTQAAHKQESILFRPAVDVPTAGFRPRVPPPAQPAATAPRYDPPRFDIISHDPLTQLDAEAAPTPRDTATLQAIAASLQALRSGLQGVMSATGPQQPHPHLQPPHPRVPSGGTVAIGALLAHVQVLEDHLLGASTMSALPTPTGMLLPLPRSPGQARYATGGGRPGGGGAACLGGGGGDYTGAAGGSVYTGGGSAYTGGGSTPLEMRSPQISEPATTPSDSPLLMATDSPAQHHHHQHGGLHGQHPPHHRQELEQQQLARRQHRPAAQPHPPPPPALLPEDTHLAAAASAAAASLAAALAADKPDAEVPESSGRARRVAAIQAFSYEDPVALHHHLHAPSLVSMLPPAGAPLWDATGVPLWRAEPITLTDAGSTTARQASGESHFAQQEEWRSETPSPPTSIGGETVLTGTPLPQSPAAGHDGQLLLPPPLSQSQREPGPEETVGVATPPSHTLRMPDVHPHPQSHRQARQMAATISTTATTPGSGSQRSPANEAEAATAAPAGPPSRLSSATSDDVGVATPKASAATSVGGAAAAVAALPCPTPQPLDASAAEQLLRYTNPCFARTPSGSELGAGDAAEGGGIGRPALRGQVPMMAYLGEELPALEVSESVDMASLGGSRRRGGFSVCSIEEGPVASMVQVAARGAGHSMPYLTAAKESEESDTPSAGRTSAPPACSPGGPDEPSGAPFHASAGESISLYGSVAECAVSNSYKVDSRASGANGGSIPTAAKSRKFSFRLSPRQGSRSSAVNASQGGATGGDSTNVAASHDMSQTYHHQQLQQHLSGLRDSQSGSVVLSASGVPPLPPGLAKSKKGSLLGKLKRAMGVGRSSANPAFASALSASAVALPPRPPSIA